MIKNSKRRVTNNMTDIPDVVKRSRETLLSKTVEVLPYLTYRECMIAIELLEYFKNIGMVMTND